MSLKNESLRLKISIPFFLKLLAESKSIKELFLIE